MINEIRKHTKNKVLTGRVGMRRVGSTSDIHLIRCENREA